MTGPKPVRLEDGVEVALDPATQTALEALIEAGFTWDPATVTYTETEPEEL